MGQSDRIQTCGVTKPRGVPVIPGVVGDRDWRTIPGFDRGTGYIARYEVSKCGRVRSITHPSRRYPKGKTKELNVRRNARVLLCSPQGTYHLHPARAVLWAWGPPLESERALDLIQYANGNSGDWCIENLRLVRRSGTVDAPVCFGEGEFHVRPREDGEFDAHNQEADRS
jgi:hypothetical protein